MIKAIHAVLRMGRMCSGNVFYHLIPLFQLLSVT